MVQSSKKYTNQKFIDEWSDSSEEVAVHTSGSTGKPKILHVRKERMRASARMTCAYLQLKAGNTALLCLSTDYIAGKMMVVRADVAQLRLLQCEPSSHPLREIEEAIDFAAMVPLQVIESLKIPEEAKRLRAIRKLIIGGGPIDSALAEVLKSFPHAVYSTYGMTETLSHIAMRRLSGDQATDAYELLPGVTIHLSADQTLVIDAPQVCPQRLITHDRVDLLTDQRFKILGRLDNVVNSGGVKIQIEELEKRWQSSSKSDFVFTSVPHPRYGEALVLLVTGTKPTPPSFDLFPAYQRPKYCEKVSEIPRTPNGKIDRKACRQLAEKIIKI